MISGVLKPEKIVIHSLYICPPHLYTVATLPQEIQKSFFQQYYSYTFFGTQCICSQLTADTF